MDKGEAHRHTAIPSRRRGDMGKVELLLMVLHTDGGGKLCLSQQLCLAKGTNSSSASLTGLISASQVPRPLRSVPSPASPDCNFRACCSSANGHLWNRLNISARKVGQGDKVLLDMDGPGPGDKEMMEEAMVESFLYYGSATHGSDVGEWSSVKLTSDDVCLFFGEDDQSETESSLEGTLSPSPPCEGRE